MRPLSPRRAAVLRLYVLLPALGGTALAALSQVAEGATVPPSQAITIAGLSLLVLGLLPLPLGYLGLCLSVLLWLPIGVALVEFLNLPIWLSGMIFAAITMPPLLALYRLGRDAGQRRYRSMARNGHPMQETEWVPTSLGFVRTHRFGRLNWAVWLVALVLILLFLTSLYVAITTLSIPFACIAMFELLAFIAVVRKWGGASWLVPLAVLPAFPFSAPILIYWADGIRPNLIYRARFSRLRSGHDPEASPW